MVLALHIPDTVLAEIHHAHASLHYLEVKALFYGKFGIKRYVANECALQW